VSSASDDMRFCAENWHTFASVHVRTNFGFSIGLRFFVINFGVFDARQTDADPQCGLYRTAGWYFCFVLLRCIFSMLCRIIVNRYSCVCSPKVDRNL